MYSDQLIPKPNNHEAYRAVYQELLRREHKYDLEELKWSIGGGFAGWLLLVVFSVMCGVKPSPLGYILWGAMLLIAYCLAIGLRCFKRAIDNTALQRLRRRGELYLPSEAMIGWVMGKVPEAKNISRREWVIIASPYVDELQACERIFTRAPFGDAEMDMLDKTIDRLLDELRQAAASQ